MPKIKHCCYEKCHNDTRYAEKPEMQGVFFVPFPKPKRSLEKSRIWLQACRKKHDYNISRNSFVCSKHFVGGMGPTEQYPHPVVKLNDQEDEIQAMDFNEPLMITDDPGSTVTFQETECKPEEIVAYIPQPEDDEEPTEDPAETQIIDLQYQATFEEADKDGVPVEFQKFWVLTPFPDIPKPSKEMLRNHFVTDNQLPINWLCKDEVDELVFFKMNPEMTPVVSFTLPMERRQEEENQANHNIKVYNRPLETWHYILEHLPLLLDTVASVTETARKIDTWNVCAGNPEEPLKAAFRSAPDNFPSQTYCWRRDGVISKNCEGLVMAKKRCLKCSVGRVTLKRKIADKIEKPSNPNTPWIKLSKEELIDRLTTMKKNNRLLKKRFTRLL